MASIRTVASTSGRIVGGLVLLALGGAAGWFALRVLGGQLTSIHAGPLFGGLGLFVPALAGLGGGLFVLVPRLRSGWALATGLAAVADAGLGVLAVVWAAHDQTLAACIGGGAALALPVAALVRTVVVWLDDYLDARGWTFAVLAGVLYAGVTIGLTVAFAVRDAPVPAWIFGVAAALPVLFLLFLRVRRRAGRVPYDIRLAGLLVPVGSLVWLDSRDWSRLLRGDPSEIISGVAALALWTLGTLIVQQIVVGLLSPEYDAYRMGRRPFYRPHILRRAQTRLILTRRAENAAERVAPERLSSSLPPGLLPTMRHADRMVAAQQIGVASALATLVVWAADSPVLLPAIVGPAVVGVLFFISLRRSIEHRYVLRADLQELLGPAHRAEGAGQDADQLRRSIVDEVSAKVGAQLDRFRAYAGAPELSTQQLAFLSDRVAERACGPIIEELGRRMSELQQRFYAEIGQVIEKGIEASVLGPPLVNFTGFMVVDLRTEDADQPARTSDGEIHAPAGSLLNMTVFVIRDESARGAAPIMEAGEQFFVVEPIHIDGGRPAALVEFDAVADSPTLQPQPHRRSATVSDTPAEVHFAFRIPEQSGRHEVWLQLYQGGRLIQAVAVRVHATTDPAPVNT